MKTGHGEKQSRLQEQAIAALMSQPTIGEAAQVAGVGVETLRLWLKDPAFCEAYRRERRAFMAAVGASLQRAATHAVAALEAITKDPEAPAAARVSSARVILEMSARTTEIEDIDSRLSALERSAAERDGSKLKAVSYGGAYG
jgi:uncharacterized protein (UPF0147 family)